MMQTTNERAGSTGQAHKNKEIEMLEQYLRIVKWLKEEKGQTLVEYALLLVLIAIVSLIILTTLGTQVSTVFSTVSSSLAGGLAS